ncbi:DUF998 domain-containing protein [Sphaerisporangium sp. NPDC005289]|uniref:DUF998 domain-containing protein n=1 Tax=Sphaerisporangium sp. NPDC005289 TaxID=3155247 RepID=UPI0033B78057
MTTSPLTAGGFAALANGAVAMTALHLTSGLDPLHGMISEYAFHPHGWLLGTSLTFFALGAAMLAVEMSRRGTGRATVALLGVWSTCMLMIAAFPTDRPGMSLSMSGGIHRYAAFTAFVSMPVAGLAIAARGGRHAAALRGLSLAAAGFLILVLVPYVVRMFGMDPGAVPAGLTQRLVVVTEVVVLVLIGLSAAVGRDGARARARVTARLDGAGPRVRPAVAA